jgi:8-oxo-dGTP pyrophosphatase MutT (NUDIX family)
MRPIRQREAVRAIVITPDRRLLMIRCRDPVSGASFWIVPGGGIEAGESHADALRRELWEELRLSDYRVGPVLWRRQHTFDARVGRLSQRETMYAVHVEGFDARFHDADELMHIDGLRWWQLDAMFDAPERFTPPKLPALVRDYLAHGAPPELPDWEVLMD